MMFARTRVTAKLIPAAEWALKRLMNSTDLRQADVINRAIQVYDEIETSRQKGCKIYVVHPNGEKHILSIDA